MSDYKFNLNGELVVEPFDGVKATIRERLEPIEPIDIDVTRPVIGRDKSFWKWVLKTVPKNDNEEYLCVGARVNIDNDGHGTITIDDDLPPGEWVVTYPEKTYRLLGVTGPIRQHQTDDGETMKVEQMDFEIEETI